MAAVAPARCELEDNLPRLNPAALEFVSRSASETGSPVRCSSPVSSEAQGGSPHAMATEQEQQQVKPAEERGEEAGVGRGSSGTDGDVIPAPTPRLSRRSSSSSLHSSGAASPPLPVMQHPGMVPTYGWANPGAYPHLYHPHPHPIYIHSGPPPPHDGPIDRSGSPPAVFPNGGSPPLPTGFISVPLQGPHGMSNPGSPTSRHMYGGSPPHGHPSPFGASPPYGSSPPGMAGSPPGMMYLPPPMLHHAHSGEYGMSHAGYMHMQQQQQQQQQADYVHRMANMSLSQPPPGTPAQQRTSGSAVSAGSLAPGSSGGGRSEGRASARIARSNRAGGAYNPAEFSFSLEEAESGRADARVTVMIRNIPNKYSQEMMLSVMLKSGFGGTFDFFYLPIDFRNKCNLGYCFVSFLHAASAARLFRRFHNKCWEEYNSKKVCEVTYGRVQGLESLVAHFRASKFPSDDVEFQPLVYTRVAGGVAADPVPIHRYIGGVDDGIVQGGSAASSVCGEAAGEGAEDGPQS